MSSHGESEVIVANQSGGRLLGQGAYGCIFTTPLRCRGKEKHSKPGRLGKLTSVEDIASEIGAAKYLGKYPDAKKYCILPEINTLCKPLPNYSQKEEDLDDCKVLKKQGLDDMMQYELEYGGKTLKYYLVNTDINAFPFFDCMRNLLEIGSFFLLHGFVHNDLHSNNIVMGDSMQPRIIDFGRSYIHSKINTNLIDELAVYYDPEIGQAPPEHSAHNGITEGVAFNVIMADLYNKKSALLYAERILGVSRRDQIASLRRFWETSKAVQGSDWATLYKLYWPAVDAWAIGYNIIGILRRLIISKQFTESKEWVEKKGVVKAVLKGLLQANPRERFDALEALALYDPMNAFVSGASGRAWLEKKVRE